MQVDPDQPPNVDGSLDLTNVTANMVGSNQFFYPPSSDEMEDGEVGDADFAGTVKSASPTSSHVTGRTPF